MRKIPTLFQRTDDRRHVKNEVTPGCEWVLEGEGTATRKYDGTCVGLIDQDWYMRREVKPGKTPPPGFIELGHDEITGKTIGWEPAAQSASGFWPILEKLIGENRYGLNGTFELIGEKINGNPERIEGHDLIDHWYADVLDDAPRDFDGLASWLRAHPYEGIVWHHPDGRMCKLKRRDFPAVDA